MKFFSFLPCLVLAVNAASILDLDLTEWNSYKLKYGKTYATEAEEKYRMKIFMENKKKVEEHNAKYQKGEVTYEMGVNQFSDLLASEFLETYNGLKQSNRRSVKGSTFVPPANVVLPDEVNWVKAGAVTPVKDQKRCGSCWAFSATGALEGQHFLKNKTLVSLSEQNLVDCSMDTGNAGCEGGMMDLAFQYVISNRGIDTEESYPYEGRDDTCRYNPKNRGATESSYTNLPLGDEDGLKAAVSTVGPISAGIDVTEAFQQYKSGIFVDDQCSELMLNHGVLVVGYGTDEKTKLDYWLVKNSWSTSWGDEGYIKMARNHGNMCGIASMASFPVV